LTEEGTYDFYLDNNGTKGKIKSVKYSPHLANSGSIELKYPPAEKYFGNGPQSVINGILGSDEKYGDAEWLGFNGKEFHANIKLNEAANNVEMRFFKGEGQWIYLPHKVQIFDIESNNLIAEETEISTDTKIATVRLKFSAPSKNVKIIVYDFGTIPDGLQGSGHPAWLFVDEIILK